MEAVTPEQPSQPKGVVDYGDYGFRKTAEDPRWYKKTPFFDTLYGAKGINAHAEFLETYEDILSSLSKRLSNKKFRKDSAKRVKSRGGGRVISSGEGLRIIGERNEAAQESKLTKLRREANIAGNVLKLEEEKIAKALARQQKKEEKEIVKVQKRVEKTPREEAYATLTEAAAEKRRKYKDLGAFFHLLILSAGGLMEKDTAKDYKALQGLLGDSSAKWLDSYIALILTQARGIAATSIIA
ncbi:hypothetical protein DL95DRAFT_471900 [Leptodontidium sp. 2 PMI_412]|nr:hypothetical protein DL95DRAFT_471900 [Leptodontidium sp. 2 PMI_412]